MTGLWLIFYDLLPEKEAEYLTWFHDVHIPEKLAREGYTWAAHYVAEGGGDDRGPRVEGAARDQRGP